MATMLQFLAFRFCNQFHNSSEIISGKIEKKKKKEIQQATMDGTKMSLFFPMCVYMR